MHESMQAEGASTTDAPAADDAEPAAIPFLAILPDMTLHVAILEKDVFTDTAPLDTRTLPLPIPTAGDSSRVLGGTEQASAAARTRSARFVPPSNPHTDAAGGPTAPHTSLRIARPAAAPHSQPLTHTFSGRLRQFGLAALPSLRRAELADIPDSLVWSVAVVDHRPPLTRLASTRSLSWRRGATSRSIMRASSLRTGGIAVDGHGAAPGDPTPLQTFNRAGSITRVHTASKGASAPIVSGAMPSHPPGVMHGQSSAPLFPGAPDHNVHDATAVATLRSSRSLQGNAGMPGGSSGLVSAVEPWQGQPGKAQRTRSLRKGRSLRAGGGGGYERLADVHEMPGEVQ